MIAVDPTDPQNIVVTAMGGLYGAPRGPRSTIPWLAVTNNGGVSWKIGELPILDGAYPRCPDPVTEVTKEGTFIAGCGPREIYGSQIGTSAIMMSADKGQSWGPRVHMIDAFAPARFAPGLKPAMQGSSPWDRPFILVDDATKVIYGVAVGGLTTTDAGPGQTRSQSYITASTDNGKSFGTIYAWDSKDYPEMSRGAGAAAAHGAAAVLYVASKAPAQENATCPCTVFGLSRDQGKTFSYHVLKNVPPPRGGAPGGRPLESAAGAAGPGGAGAGRGAATPAELPAADVSRNATAPEGATIVIFTDNSLTADPTTPGRFAIRLMVGGSKPYWEVIATDDYGATWSAPVSAGSSPEAVNYAKTTMKYSRDGVLGLSWKAVYADRSFDVWASISRDGGKTFSNPLRVSRAKSPGSVPVKGGGNDDNSDIAFDKDNIHMVWGDFRSGFLGSWYGKVALSAFEFPKR